MVENHPCPKTIIRDQNKLESEKRGCGVVDI
jgi:hypothetical protein